MMVGWIVRGIDINRLIAEQLAGPDNIIAIKMAHNYETEKAMMHRMGGYGDLLDKAKRRGYGAIHLHYLAVKESISS